MNIHSKVNKIITVIGCLLIASLSLAACQTTAAQPNTPIATKVGEATTLPTMTIAPSATLAPTATVVSPTAQPNQQGIPGTGGEVTINVADDPKLGKILVDGNGMTLYMYTKDGPNQSNCTSQCLQAWPPLLTQGNPVIGEGVDATLLGTAKLADGSLIVTYNKMPLYTWYKDKQPGDTTGQGNKNVWYVVSPDGKAVGAPTSSSTVDSYNSDYSYNK